MHHLTQRYLHRTARINMSHRVADLEKLMDAEKDVNVRQHYMSVLRELEGELEARRR